MSPKILRISPARQPTARLTVDPTFAATMQKFTEGRRRVQLERLLDRLAGGRSPSEADRRRGGRR